MEAERRDAAGSVPTGDHGEALLRELKRTRVLAILRGFPSQQAASAAEALAAGGITVLEVTADSPDWEASIRDLASQRSRRVSLTIGAGTVLNMRQAQAAIAAGATFLVAPVFSVEVARIAKESGVAYVPGALTPGEIYAAQAAGAACVKLFPADVLGPRYIERLVQPMPELRLVPTGGVTVETAAQYLGAGALAVAMGSGLVDAGALRRGETEPTRLAAERVLAATHRAEGGESDADRGCPSSPR